MPNIQVSQPAELLAAVPYVLGFHPTDSLVVVGVRARKLHFAVRVDLAECADEPDPAALHLAEMLHDQRVDSAVVIGYGPPAQVTPVVDAARRALAGRSIPLIDALRVTADRFFSYTCESAECCPPDGRAYDPGSSVTAAEATLAGKVALPDRAAFAQVIAPVSGLARVAMEEATDRAESRFLAAMEGPGGRAALAAEGPAFVEAALSRHYSGGTLTDDEAAWLCALLLLVPVRDAAAHLIEQRPDDPHLPLWTDLTRRAQPGLVAPVATLLAYAAYQDGQGALASLALDRARADDPEYSLAVLLHRAIVAGIPARRLRRRRPGAGQGPGVRRRAVLRRVVRRPAPN
ncbi:DUF4192 domain-containing protein [Longispora sp. K20-0274]|uniref:DUF4192 domain-containing protein n=1 Tax=Longispora sp. K20-0274 TaxID=3088255 RepID=UPI00399B23C8